MMDDRSSATWTVRWAFFRQRLGRIDRPAADLGAAFGLCLFAQLGFSQPFHMAGMGFLAAFLGALAWRIALDGQLARGGRLPRGLGLGATLLAVAALWLSPEAPYLAAGFLIGGLFAPLGPRPHLSLGVTPQP